MDCDREPKDTGGISMNTDKKWVFELKISSDIFEDEYGYFLKASDYDEATKELLNDLQYACREYFNTDEIQIKLKKGDIKHR